VVELNPAFNSRNGDEVVRSIEELLIQQARSAKATSQKADTANCGTGNPTHFSPSIAPAEPSIEPSSNGSSEPNSTPTSKVVRTVVAGLFLAIGVVVVWQIYHDNQNKKLIETLAHSSAIWLSSSVGSAQRISELSAQSSAKTSDQAAQTPIAISMEANELAEFRQQILAVVNDLAVLRRDVEQLSGKHEDLSRNVETVQASLQDVGEKISSLSQPVPTPAPVSAQAQPRRSVPRLVRADVPRRSDAASVPPKTSRQPDAASVPPTTSPTGTASLTEQPPRPPLPVPTAETTSPLH
jgi:hypothetical protein